MDGQLWKILLVEDDEDDYILTDDILKQVKSRKVDLTWVATYEDALDYLDKSLPDVLLVDYLLGSRTGLELLKEAIARGCKAPIILFTGQDNYEIDMQAMQTGAFDYLVKGQINATLLERTIRYAIGHKKSEDALQKAHDELEQRVLERTSELAKLNQELRAEISVRKKTEEALLSSETKFRKLAESTSTAIFIVQDMQIRYANTAARYITGYSPDALNCMEFWEIAHPAYREILKQYGVANHWAKDQSKDLPHSIPSRYELKLITCSGEERWVDVTAGSMEYEGKMAWVITMFDITERDLAEQALREAKEELEIRVEERTQELSQANQRLQVELLERQRIAEERERLLEQVELERQRVEALARTLAQERDTLQIIMENTLAHLAYLDLDFNFIRVNSSFAAGVGCTIPMLIKQNYFSIFQDQEYLVIFNRVKETGQPVKLLARPRENIDNPAAGPTYWDWSLVPVKDEAGKVQGLVYSLTDVTERKRAEEEREQHLASLNALIQISQRLLAEKTFEGLHQQIIEAAHELTGVEISATSYSYKTGSFNLDAAAVSTEDRALLAQLSALASLGFHHIEARIEAEKRADELDSVFSAIFDVITVYDANGRAVRVNPAALPVYGLDPAGLDAADFLMPLSVRKTNGQPLEIGELPSRRALRGEIVKDERLVVTSASAGVLTVLASSSPLYVHGRIAGAVSVWHDVTEIERLMSQLEAERARLSTIIANAPVGISVADQDGQIVLMNPFAKILTGIAPSNPAESEQLDETLSRLLSDPLSLSTKDGQTQINLEMSFSRLNGDLCYLLVNSAPIIDRRARVQGSVAIFQDITQRKQVEEALRQARDELELRVQERTQELAVINQELRAEIAERKRAQELLSQNAARLEALAEISRSLVQAGPDYSNLLDTVAASLASIIGDACIIWMLSDDSQRLELAASCHANPEADALLKETLLQIPEDIDASPIGRVLLAGNTLLIPVLSGEQHAGFRRYTPGPFFEAHSLASLVMVPLRIQSSLVGILGLFREKLGRPYKLEDQSMLQNLSARIALAIANIRLYIDLEEALQKEQAMRRQLVQAEKHSAISRMVASVAHELNNPIQTIQNCLFLTFQDIPTDSHIQEYLDMALSETRRVAKLVTQLREIYRPSKASPSHYVNIFSLLHDVKNLLLPHLQHQHVQWSPLYEESDVFIEGIPDQLKQVFLNISLNAIEAMQPDGGLLEVALHYSPSFDQIGVSFIDTGPGISKENLVKLFEPFFTTKDSGTGLGLSICYDIIQRHSGEITVESMPGKGATFTVWLPLVKPEDSLSKEAATA